MNATLSLADVARLCDVQRPVVSMWRKRPKGRPFPDATPDGRFLADEVVDWLEQTRRGNNPNVRGDLALQVARTNHDDAALRQLLVLLAAKAVSGLDLHSTHRDDLLDVMDELDPDDEWLFTELDAVDIGGLAAEADTLADAAWSTPDAYESLLSELRSREASGAAPGADLVGVLAGLVRSLRHERGAVVDVAGTANDVVVAMARGEELPSVPVLLPAPAGGVREARRRCAVHGLYPRTLLFDADWALPDGSVVVAALPQDPDVALDLLDEIALQLAGASTALVVGPAAVLVDELPLPLEARRDRFLRDPNRTLAAAVRLPAGMTRAGGREHLAILLLMPNAPALTRIGDLGGAQPTPALWQQLLDDLFAVAAGANLRAFALLQPVRAARLVAAGRALIDHDSSVVAELTSSAADDAARIQQLLDALAEPMPSPFTGMAPWVNGNMPAQLITLGEAVRSRKARVVSGTRMEELPAGSTALWTADSLGSATPGSVDLLAFSAAHPRAQLTRPNDVIFTSHGKPAAAVDAHGGAVVAYPARAIRVRPGEPLSPRAIAAAINQLEAGNSKWRSWQLPLVAGDVARADIALAQVDQLATQLRDRQAQVAELHELMMRTVLPGSVTFRDSRTDKSKGD